MLTDDPRTSVLSFAGALRRDPPRHPAITSRDALHAVVALDS
jgi:hypothetical protein